MQSFGFKYLLILLPFSFLVGCASTYETRSPSSYLLSSNKKTHILINKIKNSLEKSGYKIKGYDLALGVLTTNPRSFSVRRSGRKTKSTQTIQIRQEGASLKIKVVYRCKYEESDGMTSCRLEDEAADRKIRRIDRKLIRLIKKQL